MLICNQCAIQLVHIESVVNKLRKSMLRLSRPAAKATKTPSKTTPAAKSKEVSPTKKKKDISKLFSPTKVNGVQESAFKKFTDDNAALNDECLLKPGADSAKKKKSVKRKLEDSLTNGTDEKDHSTTTKADIDNENGECNETALGDKEDKRVKLDSSSIAESSTLNETIVDVDVSEQSFTKVLNCVLCGKKFNQKSLLREHIESNHMGEKLKECPNCFMEFRSVQKYESHVFSEKCKATLLPCQFRNCHRRFKNVHKMEAHMREKHLSANDI